MSYTITEHVHIDIRIDGQDCSADYTPGDVELPDAVAEILIAQGLATVTTPAGKKSKPTDPTPGE